jgi:PAS domain S-box-containing protein
MSKTKHIRRVAPASGDTLINAIPQLVWTVRPDGWKEYVNQRWCDYTGLTLAQIQSDRWDRFWLIHPDDHEGHRALAQHALGTGAVFEHEERLRNGQTGEYRWFLSRALPGRDETGRIVRWFGTCTDIDEQKRVEAALRPSQERADALMKSNIIGIFVSEGEQIVDANNTFLRMTGYTRKDLHAGRLNWLQMTPPDYRAQTLQAQQKLAPQQALTPYEKEYVRQDGSRLPVLVCGVLLQPHPLQVITFVLDNSARKELDRRKDDFINMASHELRTPLTAIKLQTQLVRKRLEKHAQHEAATALSQVESPVKQLERLIADLLDVSRIQAGSLEYVRERVDLDELLREVTGTTQHTSPSHTILVRGSVQASLIGDRDRLRQVFTNLLSNAIKYSPDATTVEIDLSTSAEAVTIRVTDHGLGIPREQRDKIFERFYRATDLSQRTIPGLGMGLYIVAEIVKGHRGTITVDSEVGKGSTFTVTLPTRGMPERGKDATHVL